MYERVILYFTGFTGLNYLRLYRLQFDEEQESEFEKIEEEDDTYAVEPMLNLCSEYVTFLMEEEKNQTAVKSEVIEVHK